MWELTNGVSGSVTKGDQWKVVMSSDTKISVLLQSPIKSDIRVSVILVYLCLTCVQGWACDHPCVHDAVCRGGWVHLSLCAICSLSIVVVCPPALAHLKWQFVKHGPLLAFSISTQPFPAWLLLSLMCPSSLLFASLGLPSFFNFLSFPYRLDFLHLLSVHPFISLCCSV